MSDREDIITRFPSNMKEIDHIVLLVISVFTFFSTVLLNVVAITTIWIHKDLRAKVSHFTVMMRSVMDLATGIIIFPLFIALLSREIGGNPDCSEYFISKKLGALFCLYSITVMCIINFERYMGILHPFVHREKVTKARLMIFTVFALVLQTVLFSISIIHVQIFPRVLAATTLLLISTTIFVYMRIFFAAKNQLNVVVNRKSKLLKQLKLAGSSFIIVVCFLACSLPSTIVYIDRLEIQSSFSLVVRRRWFALLFMLSTTLNPIIFFWRDKAMRIRGKQLVKRSFFCS